MRGLIALRRLPETFLDRRSLTGGHTLVYPYYPRFGLQLTNWILKKKYV
jgi:hypothetical protein